MFSEGWMNLALNESPSTQSGMGGVSSSKSQKEMFTCSVWGGDPIGPGAVWHCFVCHSRRPLMDVTGCHYYLRLSTFGNVSPSITRPTQWTMGDLWCPWYSPVISSITGVWGVGAVVRLLKGAVTGMELRDNWIDRFNIHCLLLWGDGRPFTKVSQQSASWV